MRIAIVTLIVSLILIGCKPPVEKVYEGSFALRAARELDSTGDAIGARFYLRRAVLEPESRSEAESFLRRTRERKVKASSCIDDKRTDLEINQYPRIRHKHFFQLAVCLESAGESDKALKAYKLSENAGSRQPQLYIRRALLREKIGDRAAAGEDFARAVQLNAEYPPALLAHALHFLRTNQTEAARAIGAKLASSKPFYADIIQDALKDRENLLKAWQAKEADGW